jgi:hypothetical protein
MAIKAIANLSRRSLIGTTIAAAAIPAAVIPKAQASDGDVELLELGRQLRELLPGERAAEREAHRLFEVQKDRMAPFPDPANCEGTWEDILKYRELEERVCVETGYREAADAVNAYGAAMWPLAEKITAAAKATTIEGLAAKALATGWVFANIGINAESEIFDLLVSVFALAKQEVPEFVYDLKDADEDADADA